jgi:hypothetical protein
MATLLVLLASTCRLLVCMATPTVHFAINVNINLNINDCHYNHNRLNNNGGGNNNNNWGLISSPRYVFLFLLMDKKVIGKCNVLIFDLGGGTFDVSILTIRGGSTYVVRTSITIWSTTPFRNSNTRTRRYSFPCVLVFFPQGPTCRLDIKPSCCAPSSHCLRACQAYSLFRRLNLHQGRLSLWGHWLLHIPNSSPFQGTIAGSLPWHTRACGEGSPRF